MEGNPPGHRHAIGINRFLKTIFLTISNPLTPCAESTCMPKTMNEHEDYENENLCIASEGFLLLPEHLEGLREIRRMRLEIDPSGCIPALGTETI